MYRYIFTPYMKYVLVHHSLYMKYVPVSFTHIWNMYQLSFTPYMKYVPVHHSLPIWMMYQYIFHIGSEWYQYIHFLYEICTSIIHFLYGNMYWYIIHSLYGNMYQLHSLPIWSMYQYHSFHIGSEYVPVHSLPIWNMYQYIHLYKYVVVIIHYLYHICTGDNHYIFNIWNNDNQYIIHRDMKYVPILIYVVVDHSLPISYMYRVITIHISYREWMITSTYLI